jgi:uncharacterized protein YgbK (DUF1537 family)
MRATRLSRAEAAGAVLAQAEALARQALAAARLASGRPAVPVAAGLAEALARAARDVAAALQEAERHQEPAPPPAGRKSRGVPRLACFRGG